MKTGLKPVLWSGAVLLLLLMLTIPLLNLIAFLLLMVPYAVLYATLPRASFWLHLIPVWIIAGIVIGPAILVIGLFFLVPGIVMGHLYRKGAPAAKVLRQVCLVFLTLLMLELLVFELILNVSLINQMTEIMRTMMDDLMAQSLIPAGLGPDFTELVIRTVINSIPLAFIMISFVFTVVTHYIARRVVIRHGVEVPAFPKAKEWRLPRVIVVYYLIAYVMQWFIPVTSESFLAIALMNLVPILSYVFAIQAIGLFFFIAHERNWNRAVPVLLGIVVLLFPPLSIIGVLDTAFPLRKMFTKS